MKRSHFSSAQLWRILTIWLGLIALASGLWLGKGQTVSWAAPEQNPYQQTVPTRPPTSVPPTSPPSSPAPAPPTEQPGSPPEGDDGEDIGSAPGQPPAKQEDEENDGLPAIQPLEQTTGEDQGEIRPIQPPEPKAEAKPNGASPAPLSGKVDGEDSLPDAPLPADLDESKTVDKETPSPGEDAITPDSTPLPASGTLTLSERPVWLTGLYALILGVALIFIGLYLVKRA